MSHFPIAYLINQYPKVSHSFIRREILELERQGWTVLRMALRGWDSEVVDAQDVQERERTRYVLKNGVIGLLPAVLHMVLARPRRSLGALYLALAMGRRGARAWPYHLLYLAQACRIVLWMKRDKVRHLHAHFGTNSAEIAMLATKLGGPPYSFTVHGPEEFDKSELLRIGEKIKRAAFVVAISSFGRSQLYRCVQHAQWSKVRVVHCGLEPAFYGIPAGPVPTAPRLVCVGRLCEQKGQLLLLDAVGKLARAGKKFELILAGEGDMRSQLESHIAGLNLQGSVRITGWLTSAQVREEILAARALVLPSFAEGLPVVLMEAMALRRPVLGTYVAGIPELVRHGDNGWLFPAGDVDALASVLDACLSTSDEQLQKMGESARCSALERHRVEIEVGKLAHHFRCAGTAGGGAGALP